MGKWTTGRAAAEVLEAQPPPQSPGAGGHPAPGASPWRLMKGCCLHHRPVVSCVPSMGLPASQGAAMSGGRGVLPRAWGTCLRSPRWSGAEGRGRCSGLPQTWCGMAGLGHSLLPEVLREPGHLVPAGLGPSVPHCHGQEGPPSEPTGVTRPRRESRRAGHSAAPWSRVMVLTLFQSHPCEDSHLPGRPRCRGGPGGLAGPGPPGYPSSPTDKDQLVSTHREPSRGPPCPAGPSGLTGHKPRPQTSPTWKPRMPGAPGGPCGPRAP